MGNISCDQLSARVEALERSNRKLRLLSILSLGAPLLAVVGWQAKPSVPNLLQVRKLEVVDDRGVPMVALGVDPQTLGGNITLRDRGGEKRGWWTANAGGAALGMTGDTGSGAGGMSLGMSTAADEAQLSIAASSGSGISAGIAKDHPKIDLWNSKGKSLFSAPWN
jgi:hypothetical protein